VIKGWALTTLGGVSSDISYGYTASADHELDGPKFLRITDIVGGRVDWESVPSCEISDTNRHKYLLTPGDIVIARTGATTGANYALKRNDPSNVVFASYLIRYRIDRQKADAFFVGHLLTSTSWQDYVNAISGGSAQPGANAKQLASFELLLPPLPEQRAIADVLSSLDDKIDLLYRQNATLEALAETLFRQYFIEEAQDDWEEVELQKVANIGIGRTPPRKEFHWFSKADDDWKWLSIKDMADGDVFVLDTAEKLTREAVERFNIPVIPKDTVVLSFKMTVGRVAISTEEMLSNEAIAHFKLAPNAPITREFLLLFLKSYQYDQLGSTSSIVTAINSRMIKELVIVLPPHQIMTVFQERVESVFARILENQKQIQTLEKLRDTLLPKLMSGEVRVSLD
jgi:type I restriction enzyme S subunit